MIRLTRPGTKTPARGAVVYRGPSLLDGAPIIAVATLRTENPKTGPMLQTWILPDPTGGAVAESIRDGRDASVCGNCPRRPSTYRAAGVGRCYVQTSKAPHAVGQAYARGAYPDLSRDLAQLTALGAGRAIRLGAYGDPAAVPLHLWAALLAESAGHTGYTHQWRTAFPGLSDLVMASVDSPAEQSAAAALGWRTFRAYSGPVDLAPTRDEITCPASAEAGARVTCSNCRLCSGASFPAKSVKIRNH